MWIGLNILTVFGCWRHKARKQKGKRGSNIIEEEKVEDDSKTCLAGCFSNQKNVLFSFSQEELKCSIHAFYASKNADLLTAEIENDSLSNTFTLFIIKRKKECYFLN